MSKNNKYFNKDYSKIFESNTAEKDKQDVKSIIESAPHDMHDSILQDTSNIAEEEAYKPEEKILDVSEKKEENNGYVKGVISDGCPNGLNFRKEPLFSSEVIEILYPGDEIEFTDTDIPGEWAKVKKGNKYGYCLCKYIVKTIPTFY